MDTIVFVHGMFVTRQCWKGWLERLAPRFRCTAPAWPLRDATPAELRARHPDPALGKLTMGDVLANYEAIIRALPEPPLLVGHSLGGLMVQLLLQKGLGKKGVAIDSAPPRGVLPLEWSVVRANWPTISPFVSKSVPVLLTPAQFRYAFAHTLPEDEVARIWDAQVVPESRQMPKGAMAAKVAWDAPHAPLLLVAGGEDRICTQKMNTSNARKYRPPVELKVFPGRTHYTILDGDGWTEVADYVADWLAA
jgi:pimeloyl-ACP methyl ester carboxylesterase